LNNVDFIILQPILIQL